MPINILFSVSPIAACILLLIALLLGAIFGSFVNCAAWRKVHGGSALKGRSICPSCEHQLAASDLVPVVSYMKLRGTCRYCGAPVPRRYVVSELLGSLAFLAVVIMYGVSLQSLAYCALACVLLGVSLTDLEDRRIPNAFILAGFISWATFYAIACLTSICDAPALWGPYFEFGIINEALPSGRVIVLGSLFTEICGGNTCLAVLFDALAGGLGIAAFMLVCSLLLGAIMGKQTLGAGDVKLFFLTGLFLGLAGNLLNVLLSCLIGGVFGIIYGRVHKSGPGSAFPFGPAIAISTFFCILFAPVIVTLYLSSFGL